MMVDPAGPAASTLAHSAELRRELGVRDLVFAQVLMVVGGTWVGTAGKLGAANLGYWLLAATLFFVPHVVVVLFLNRWAPLEGGPYQWAKLAFGPAFGFLVAFNLWLYAISLIVSLGLDVVQALAYAFDRLAWMRTDPLVAPVVSVALIAALAAESLVGLHFGKRLHNTGGAVRFAVFAMLLLIPIVALVFARPLRPEATHVEAPPLTLLGVNLLAKMGFGAFCGLEYAAIFAGESRNPARAFARSVHVGAPLIVVMFVAGTASVLAFVAPADIDLVAPIPQVLGIATAGLGPASHIASVATVLWVVTLIAAGGVGLTGITRLPMVAGWDGLLPAWFMRLSPRSRVPVNSILFVSAVVAALSVLGLTGVEHQEAYQLFLNAGLLCWALTYLVMFAIPIVGRGPGMPRPPVWLRLAAASGWGMTLLFVVFAVVPIVRVVSAAAFGVKMIGVVVGANAAGVGLYLAGKRRGAAGSVHAERDPLPLLRRDSVTARGIGWRNIRNQPEGETMTANEVAKKYVGLCKEGKNEECLALLFAEDAVSVEAGAPPGVDRTVKGLAAIRGKSKWWTDNHTVHKAEVFGPYPHDDRFAVRFLYDITNKPSGKRFTMDEVGLFTVVNGKITREEFFYSAG